MVLDPYQHWLSDYSARRAGLSRELSEIGFEATRHETDASLSAGPGMIAAAAYARRRRRDVKHKFCLLLWSRRFQPDAFQEIDPVDVELESASAILTMKEKNFRPRIRRLTERLDRAGYYAAMLDAEGEDAPPEPLVMTPPPGMWFEVFRIIVELAEAIIVEANYSRGLFTEFQHIHRAGLDDRMLLFDVNDTLYRPDDERRWTLDEIRDAVAFARAQPAV